MKAHKIKTIQPYFDQITSGEKTFELRKNDRNYQKGDILICEEYDPEYDAYTGSRCKFKVTSILYGEDAMSWGLDIESCIMSIEPFMGEVDFTIYKS